MTRMQLLALTLLVALLALSGCAGSATSSRMPAGEAGVYALDLTGYEVYNPAGKWLGEVASVLINPETGQIEQVVLCYRVPRTYGRALMVTNPERFIPIPWGQFMPLAREAKLVLDADEMTLIPAPYLQDSPRWLSVQLSKRVDAYWESTGHREIKVVHKEG